MVIKDIILSRKGIFYASLKSESNKEYAFIGLFDSNNNEYGPVILVENVKWSKADIKNIILTSFNNLSKYFDSSNGTTYIKINDNNASDFFNNIAIGMPLLDASNNRFIYIGNNTLWYEGNYLNDTININRYFEYDKYSSVFILYNYWRTIIPDSVGHFYERLVAILPAFISSLHVIDGKRFVGFNNDTANNLIEFLCYFQTKKQINDNTIEYSKIDLYINYKSGFNFGNNFIIYTDIHRNFYENYYQSTSGYFDEEKQNKKFNKMIIYEEIDWDNCDFIPIDMELMYILYDENKNKPLQFNYHNLFKTNAYIRKNNDLFFPKVIDIKVDDNDNILESRTLFNSIKITNNPNFDLKFINDANKHYVLFSFGKLNREEAIKYKNNEINIEIKDILHYNNVFRNANHLTIYVNPKIIIKKYEGITISDVELLSSDYNGKIIGVIGKDVNNNIFPVAFRIDFNNIGNKIIIFKEYFEDINDIYLIIDENSYKAEKRFIANNDYAFNKITVLPKEFVLVLFTETSLINEIPDNTPFDFSVIKKQYPNTYITIINPLRYSLELKDYNIVNKYSIFKFLLV